MAKRMPGIVVGARARKKAGLNYKINEGWDQAAQQHVKGKASKMGTGMTKVSREYKTSVKPMKAKKFKERSPIKKKAVVASPGSGLKQGIKDRLVAESEMGITRGAKAWGGRRFNKHTDPVKR